VQSDARHVGIGAVLQKNADGIERLIAFYSQKKITLWQNL